MKVKKAPGAETNTNYTVINGDREIKGKRQMIPLTVMFTSDNLGETISIIDEYGKVRLTVPFEPVEELIKATRE